ncbi:hypothetical protein RFI_39781 [Reticulomyxa filosa]|uniref:Uncharacterized protein n=1 Tax=Reticulomyxa filosa TaxID=46433 RepID=X6LAI7_RETFI|nr:hypothetical protein RFI_39781 [Reticulomyxa filosa]|eukprot:ETN97744.1 hypothetical protein RFI_39781 [Reticulomyxa filosa]
MCKEAQIGWMSREDMLKALRKIPQSCVYEEHQAKIRGKSGGHMVILHPNEHEKINKIYEKYKEISKVIEDVQMEITELEENGKKAKDKVMTCCKSIKSSIETYEQQMMEKIESYKNMKKQILTDHLNHLHTIEQLFKVKNEEINHCINDSDININDRKLKLQQLLDDSSVQTISWNNHGKQVDTVIDIDSFDSLFDSVKHLFQQYMVIHERGIIKMDIDCCLININN